MSVLKEKNLAAVVLNHHQSVDSNESKKSSWQVWEKRSPSRRTSFLYRGSKGISSEE